METPGTLKFPFIKIISKIANEKTQTNNWKIITTFNISSSFANPLPNNLLNSPQFQKTTFKNQSKRRLFCNEFRNISKISTMTLNGNKEIRNAKVEQHKVKDFNWFKKSLNCQLSEWFEARVLSKWYKSIC